MDDRDYVGTVCMNICAALDSNKPPTTILRGIAAARINASEAALQYLYDIEEALLYDRIMEIQRGRKPKS